MSAWGHFKWADMAGSGLSALREAGNERANVIKLKLAG